MGEDERKTTEAQRKAYILADNRLGELADWDMNLVTSELEMLLAEGYSDNRDEEEQTANSMAKSQPYTANENPYQIHYRA